MERVPRRRTERDDHGADSWRRVRFDLRGGPIAELGKTVADHSLSLVVLISYSLCAFNDRVTKIGRPPQSHGASRGGVNHFQTRNYSMNAFRMNRRRGLASALSVAAVAMGIGSWTRAAEEKPKVSPACVEKCRACAAVCKNCADCCKGENEACSKQCNACHHLCLACAASVEQGSPLAADVCTLCEKMCTQCAAMCAKSDKECCKTCMESCKACAEACKAARG